MNVKSGHFYVYFARSVKVSDDSTCVSRVGKESAGSPLNYQQLLTFQSHWNKLSRPHQIPSATGSVYKSISTNYHHLNLLLHDAFDNILSLVTVLNEVSVLVPVLPITTWLQSLNEKYSDQKSLRNFALPNLAHLFWAQVRVPNTVALFSKSFSDKENILRLYKRNPSLGHNCLRFPDIKP
jgi:hypothetical protein